MSERKKAPVVRVGEAFTVFDRYIDPVKSAGEIPTPGRLCARAVWKSGVKNTGEFFHNDRSLWKLACLQIGINVFLLYVNVMVFGEVRPGTVRSLRVAVVLSIVEALGS